MEKFVVSARKYRPQTFDTVVGQSAITTTLKNAIKNNQLAHAFLFCGPRGVGKTTCARILAKTINCQNRRADGEACNECHSCVSFNEGTSLNIHELDAASNNSVDDIRHLVDQVRFAPQAGKYKVYIVDEVHMLSASAFNAFLKTLEEPPPYAIFILATTEKHKILPTILSRCQVFDFKRITLNDTVEHLADICRQEEMKADKTSLQLIAQKSEGCLRDALSILDKISSFTNGELTYTNTLEHLNILDEGYYFKLMDCMMQQDLSGALLLYNEIYKKGFEGDLVLDGFMEFIRNLLVCQDQKASVLLDVVESFKDKYRETAKKISPAFLVSALNILNETELHYKAARNKRLHLEMALIRLSYLQQAISLTSEGEHTIKKKRVDETRPVAFRNLTPIEIKPKNVEGKSQKTSPIQGARLTIDTPVEKPKPVNYQPASPAPTVNQFQENEPKPTSKTTLGALAKIREQVKSNGKSIGQKLNEPIQLPQLEMAWKAIGCMLQEEKNPAYKSFELARLVLKDENSFTVFTANNLEQKFIEKERNKACSYLQQELRNTSIQFTIEIDDNMPKEALQEAPLSSSAQFAKMATQYPLIKELKDRLRLELDY